MHVTSERVNLFVCWEDARRLENELFFFFLVCDWRVNLQKVICHKLEKDRKGDGDSS